MLVDLRTNHLKQILIFIKKYFLRMKLNIVKNLTDLHNGSIGASNRHDRRGANLEIKFPRI